MPVTSCKLTISPGWNQCFDSILEPSSGQHQTIDVHLMTKIANRQKKKLINTVNYIKKPLETNLVKLKQNCESNIFLKLSALLIRSREKRRECIGKGKGNL